MIAIVKCCWRFDTTIVDVVDNSAILTVHIDVLAEKTRDFRSLNRAQLINNTSTHTWSVCSVMTRCCNRLPTLMSRKWPPIRSAVVGVVYLCVEMTSPSRCSVNVSCVIIWRNLSPCRLMASRHSPWIRMSDTSCKSMIWWSSVHSSKRTWM